MMKRTVLLARGLRIPVAYIASAVLVPGIALAQAGSPFETGATNLQTTVIAIAAPVAVLLVIALGVAAAAGRISVGWALGVILGIGIVFAAQPVVTWIRGLFGA
jgi:type IV secretory pathway VirB2 component (pilin)